MTYGYQCNKCKQFLELKKKEPDTIIYRLAMAIYHSEINSGKAAIAGIEDPSRAYLNMLGDSAFVAKYQQTVIDRFANFETDMRSQAVKTFLVFLLGAYLYYSVTNE